MKTYVDFELWIEAPFAVDNDEHAPTYRVQVADSPSGLADEKLNLDIDEEEFKHDLLMLNIVNLAQRQQFGQKLFAAIFHGKVRDAWIRSWEQVERLPDAGLRFLIRINDARLAALPWELMCDEEQNFLATNPNMSFARYLDVREPRSLVKPDPLRILVVIAAPEELSPIKPEEIERLKNGLAALGDRVHFTVLENATVSEIRQELDQEYHIFHFLGHGKAGRIALVKDDRKSLRILDDIEFAQFFLGHRTIRLIVLNACHSSHAGNGDDQEESRGLFLGIGPSLVQKRIPAVIAMQYPSVSQQTAGRFSHEFYRRLLDGDSVDIAVNQARRSLSIEGALEDRDWSTPVLYMGTRLGRLLDFASDDQTTVDHARNSINDVVTMARNVAPAMPVFEEIEAAAIQAKATLDKLTPRFEQMANSHYSLSSIAELTEDVRNLQVMFRLVAQAVERADSPLALNISTLKTNWTSARQNALTELQVFSDLNSQLTAQVQINDLFGKAQKIDEDLQSLALGSLMNTIPAFQAELTAVELRTVTELRKAIQELIALSDRTLGQLAVI